MSRFIPTFNEPFLDGRGCITPIWRDYLRSIPADAALAVIEQQLAALGLRVTELEQQAGSTGNVVGRDSVTQYGVLSEGFVQLALVGDEPTPDPLRYYGTDADGERGYHELPSGGVPYFVPEGSTFRVREYLQALFSMPIDCEGFLDVDGFLVEVD